MGGEHVLIPGRPYHVYVTYYQSPAKFWVQCAENSIKLDELHDQIAEYYQNANPPVPPIVERGKVVWARYKQGSADCFYRGRVESVMSDGQCKIYFIDYGNSDIMSVADIRDLPRRFTAMPGQAIECSLSGATAFTADIGSLTDCETLYLKTLSVTDKGLHLVELAMSPTEFQTSNPRRGEYSNGAFFSVPYHFSPLQFNLASFIDVCISHVEDSGSFHCQLIDQAQNLKEVMFDIQAKYNNDSAYVTQPQPELPCIVQDPDDNIYYRAKILSISGTSVDIKYVDFGSSRPVSISCLRQILEEHTLLPSQSIECSLSGAEKMDPGMVVELLKQYDSSVPLVLKVVFKTTPHYEVELIDTNGGEDIYLINLLRHGKTSLPKQSQKFKTTSIKLLIPNPDVHVNDEEKVFITAILSDRLFYGQLCKYDADMLEQMVDDLTEVYAGGGQPAETALGNICCAQFTEDGRFYRGKIVDIQGQKAKVFFLDYGNQEWKSVDQIYELEVEFYSLPQQGIKCELKDSYSDQITKPQLEELLLEKEAIVKLESRHGDIFTISVPECADNDDIAPRINIFQQHRAQAKGRPVVKSSPSTSITMEYVKPQVQLGQSYEAIVTHVESPDLFFCQLQATAGQLDMMMVEIGEYCNNLLVTECQPEEIVIGLPCLALYSEDGGWYRAIITGVKANGSVEVNFVDFGNHEITQRSKLKVMPDTFLRLPVQGITASMQGIKCRPGEVWTQQEADDFFNLVSHDGITITLTGFTSMHTGYEVVLMEGAQNLNQAFAALTDKVTQPTAPRPTAVTHGAPATVVNASYSLPQTVSDHSQGPASQALDVGAYYKAYVTFVQTPSEFYCQLEEADEPLAEYMQELSRDYAEGNMPGITNLSVGMYCCAVYSADGQWYRAQVVSMNGLQAVVRFLDYGNTDTVNAKQVRQLTAKHLSVTRFAFKCSLYGVKPLGSTWSDEASNKLEELTLEQPLVLSVKKKTEDLADVTIENANTKLQIHEQLISLGLVSQAAKPSPARPGARRLASAVPPVTAPASDPSIMTMSFAPKIKHSVVMGHVNSPNQFWCQPADLADALEVMMEKMQEDYNSLNPGDLKVHHPWVGQTIAAKFTDDDRWYRAEITQLERSSIKVKYVDYGNSEWLSAERVRVLKVEYINCLASQALECSLDGISPLEPEWSEPVNKLLEDVTFDKELTFNVTKARNKVYHGTLVQVDTGKSVGDILVQQGLAKTDDFKTPVVAQRVQPNRPTQSLSPQLPQSTAAAKAAQFSRSSSSSGDDGFQYRKQTLTPGERFACLISWINHPKDFYCQRLDAEFLVQDLMESMNAMYNQLQPGDDDTMNPAVGQAMVAPYSADGNWYRANVVKIKGNKAKVLFVDFGNTEVVELSKLKHVAREFRRLPEQAIHCGIEGIEVPPAGWNQKVVQLFQHVCSQKVMCSVVSLEDKINLVQLEDAKNQDIGAQLIQLGVPASPTGSLAGSASGNNQGFGGSKFGGERRGFGGNRDEQPRRGFGSSSNDGDQPRRGFEDSHDRRGAFGGERKGRFGGDESGERRGFGGDRKGGRFGDDSGDKRGGFGERKGRFGDDDSGDRRGGGRFGGDKPRSGFGGQDDKPRRGFGDSGGFPRSGGGGFRSDGGFAQANDAVDEDWGDSSTVVAAAAAPVVKSAPVVRTTQALSTVSSYKSLEQPMIGLKIKVEVVYAESTTNFWIQLGGHTDMLDKLMGQLSEFYSQLTGSDLALSNPTPGMPCVAKYSEDNEWYRAKVLGTDNGKIRVFFVDYGNADQVAPSDVKQLKKEYSELAVQAIQCSLAGMKYSSPAAVEKFNELTEGKTLFAEVIDHCSPQGLSVLLKDEVGTDINSNIKAILAETVYPDSQIPAGQEVEVIISHVNSPGSFYITPADKIDDAANLGDSLLTLYSDDASTSILVNAAVGFPCVAKYSEDQAWYRAVISSITGTKVTVTFIDYGNQDTVEANTLKAPLPEHLKIPPYATHCHITGLPLEGWTEKDREELDSLAVLEPIHATVADNKDPAGVTLKVKGEDIKDKFAPPKPAVVTLSAASTSIPPVVISPASVYPHAKPPMNGPTEVFVTHVNSANSFYVQLASAETDVTNLAEKILATYDRLGPQDLILENHEVGKQCVAKFTEDKAWYRAVITQLRGSQVTVRFVDYGNSDTIDRTTLKSPTAELMTLPCYAIHCSLAGASEDIIDKLKDPEASFIMTVQSAGNPCKVTLTNSEDIPLATPVEAVVQPGPSDAGANTYPPPSIPDQHRIAVYVAHSESPVHFFLQFAEQENDLVALADKLEAEYGSISGGEKALSNPKVGSACIAKFEEDENWYRAIIESITGDKCEVHFVDYGNTETVDVSGLKCPSPELLRIPVYAVHCKLHGVHDGSWNEEQVSQFNDTMVGDSEKLAEFVTKILPATVKIYEQDKNMADMFTAPAASLATMSYPEADVPSSECSTFMMDVASPNKFYLQLSSCEAELTTFSTMLSNHYSSTEAGNNRLLNPAVGMICMSLYSEDNQWYRAVIEGIENGKANVRFVDYGNTDTMDVSTLREIAPEHAAKKQFTYMCTLSGLPTRTWPQDAVDKLLELTMDRALKTTFKSASPPYQVILVNEEDTVINEEFRGEAETEEAQITSPATAPLDLVPSEICRQLPQSTLPEDPVHCYILEVFSPAEIYVELSSVEDQKAIFVQKIADTYGSGQGKDLPEIAVGVYCCAKYNDGLWYRAVVKEVSGEDVTVLFVDYGNTDVVKSSELKALDSQFSQQPAFALPCRLQVTNEQPWTEAQTESLQEASADKEFTVTFLTQDPPYIVKLVDGELDLTHLLQLKTDVVTSATVLMEPESETPSREMPVFATLEQNTEEVAVRTEVVSSEPPTQQLGQESVSDNLIASPAFSVIKIPTATVPVTVSHVNSVNSFYVQLESSQESMDEMLGSLTETYEEGGEDVQDITPGKACCALYSNDQSWYRAKILGVDGASVRVMFVDYGNVEVVNTSNLKACTSKFLSKPSMAILCSLADITINEDLTESFQKLVEDQVLSAEFLTQSQPCRVRLKLGESNVATQLQGKQNDEDEEEFQDAEDDSNVKDEAEASQDAEQNTHAAQDAAGDDSSQEDTSESSEGLQPEAEDASQNEGEVVIQDAGNPEPAIVAEATSQGSVHEEVACEVMATLEEVASSQNAEVDDREAKSGDEASSEGASERDAESSDAQNAAGDASSQDHAHQPKPHDDSITEHDMSVASHASDNLEQLTLGNKEEVIVCHVESPSLFWVRPASVESTIDSLQQTLIGRFQGLKPEEPVTEGQLCIAKYDDDAWYRAKVLDIQEEEATVCFIDYGNIDVVSLSRVFSMPEDLAELPGQARQCLLAGVTSPDGSWSANAVQQFQDLVLERKVLAIYEDDIEVGKSDAERAQTVKLLSVGISVASKLIDSGLAVASENSVFLPVFAEDETESSQFESSDEQRQQDLIQKTKVPYKEKESDLQTEVESKDTNVEAREQEKTEDVDTGSLSLPLHIAVEVYVACVHIPAGIIDIYPADLPDSEDIIQCRLADLKLPEEEDWSTELQTYLCDLIDKKVTVTAMERQEDTYMVHMQDGEGSIVETILRRGLLQPISEVLEKQVEKGDGDENEETAVTSISYKDEVNEGDEMTVYVSSAVSPDDFHCQSAKSSSSSLPLLMDKIQDFQSSLTKLSSVEVGQSCIAQYDVDKTWYRAQVTSIKDDSLDVLFVDYGNSSTVPLHNVKVITADIAELPLQSFHCKLQGIHPSSSHWDLASCSRFEEMVTNKEMTCKVCSIHRLNGRLVQAEVELAYPQGGTIAQELIQEGYAASKPKSDTPSLFPTYQANTELEVCYISGDSPDCFVCRVIDSDVILQKLTETLTEYCKEAAVIASDKVAVGCVCAVQAGGTWSRAVIAEVKDNTCKVRLLDKGTELESACDELRQLQDQHQTLATQSITCKLAGVQVEPPLEDTEEKASAEPEKSDAQSSEENAMDNITAIFKELCGTGPLKAKIVSSAGEGVNVVYDVMLSNKNGESINSSLISRSNAWVTPAISFTIDPDHFDSLAIEQDDFENSFLEVSYMKDNSLGELDDSETQDDTKSAENTEQDIRHNELGSEPGNTDVPDTKAESEVEGARDSEIYAVASDNEGKDAEVGKDQSGATGTDIIKTKDSEDDSKDSESKAMQVKEDKDMEVTDSHDKDTDPVAISNRDDMLEESAACPLSPVKVDVTDPETSEAPAPEKSQDDVKIPEAKATPEINSNEPSVVSPQKTGDVNSNKCEMEEKLETESNKDNDIITS